jgi:hypothetical protein
MQVSAHITKVANLRRRIRSADESVPDWEVRDLWDKVQSELRKVRLYGDLVLAAFFESEKPKEQEGKRAEYANAVMDNESGRYHDWLERRRYDEQPFVPLHWEIEFPEVFDRERPGFDAFVGNPPFQGGRNISTSQGAAYSRWLLESIEGTNGGADLVAYFFRRAFDLLRPSGTFGLIATNTVAQGDTRASGLRWICANGGELFAVRKRVKWPGLAAVVVSIVHVTKGRFDGVKRLDDRKVATITAFFFHRGGNDDPNRLSENTARSFQGNIVLGMGFTFDDTEAKGVATSLAEMQRLLREDLYNQEVIFPYIGGEEVNTHPRQVHHRYIIDFGERDEAECWERWPKLMAIVEAKVKPERITKDAKKYPRMVDEWWKYWNARPELRAAIAGLKQVLVVSRVGHHAAFAFIGADMIHADSLIVFPLSTRAAFCTLQSRPHEIWARFFGSSMKDDLRYTPTDCFETFPFPENWEADSTLEIAGKTYYDFRAGLMVRNDEGLTKTYNRFHDPNESEPEILRLRELHSAMDRVVLDAYGWSDIKTDCEFILDYEIDEEEWGDRKKPYRHRWPDAVRDEVLARLLELNAERAKKEARLIATATIKRSKKAKTKRSQELSDLEDLFS